MTRETTSVVMSVWNGGAYLKEAIDSILDQTYAPIELVVVDDGSTDQTNSIIRAYGDRVRLLTQDHSGQSVGLIAGIAVATGRYLAFLDGDDIWTPDKLARQHAAQADTRLEAVFCLSKQFVSPELADAAGEARPRKDVLVREFAGCMLIRRPAFDRIGNFDPLSKTAFVEWLGRAKHMALRYAVIEEVLHHRRLHASNFGKIFSEERDKSLLAALRLQIVRSRSGGRDEDDPLAQSD
ncbi:glycosyltransferase family A protein [Bradyrhizobium prioriisuperbiae]|uniref:glycosyltransferase family 2 protein n=1 Tax=Bradyrhizobium prioriisuperbiae TaxID=2854389 RepID=UPI0028E1EE65|nr:glycosyltransferase family A protein [Bradyrhizobium prioritasuperba]